MIEYDFKNTEIADIVNSIIIYAVSKKASDIHFDPSETGLKVRLRIDGVLRDHTVIPALYQRNLTTRIKLISNMNITESRLPQDGAIKGSINGIELDMRISSLNTNLGEKIVMRILDYSQSTKGLESLGFSNKNLEKIKRMISVPNGIILVTGATGTGKSTTVYTMLQYLNKEDTNIITVEDPIEMNIEGINQVQVNSEIGLTFGRVLRSILRQDPNIILIGEIRDTETAQIAVRASITGHLVFSTIHTNNSLTTIERLLDMDVERYLLSTALTGIVSQKLARKLCKKCRKLRPTSFYEKSIFKKYLDKDVNEIYDVDGHCDNCREGYSGRTAVQEVLLIDDHIRNAINNDDISRAELTKMVYTGDVVTLLQDGLEKVLDGITTFSEIYRIVEVENFNDDEIDINNDIQVESIQKDIQETKVKSSKVKVENEDLNVINNKPIVKNIDLENIPNDIKRIDAREKISEGNFLIKKEKNLENTELLDLGSLM